MDLLHRHDQLRRRGILYARRLLPNDPLGIGKTSQLHSRIRQLSERQESHFPLSPLGSVLLPNEDHSMQISHDSELNGQFSALAVVDD